ncbi:MYCBP-associated protein [Kryptolebias marmoratus]|uniref:MYCBP-associated protein n=1 Tax=Kryptolebias marmoratus TaxID=37003 RepID=UPI0007F8C0AD|nr:MYCBP-associated protein [Kryptolebias marmoratus]
MSHRESPRPQFGPLGRSESREVKMPDELLTDDRTKNTTMDLHSLPDKFYKAKHPKDCQKAELMAHQRSATDGVRNAAEATLPGKDFQQSDYAAWLQFDERGMVLPHSILGRLEDFQSYLQAKGEKDLVKQIPKPSGDLLSEARRTDTSSMESETPSPQRNIQSNALHHWEKRMRHRRQQQEELSYLLDRPVGFLLMNQADHFRETQEQREILNRVMPLTHSGYGYRVGSEFWSLPQRYGDEMSGIAATLTQTERGQKKPVTHVGQPRSIQRELGIPSAKIQRPASRTWSRSSYLQHQCQELKELLQEMDIKKPDISKLEVIGRGKPFTSTTVRQRPLLENEREEKEHKEIIKENLSPPAEPDHVQVKTPSVPALRIHGQLARWTGKSAASEGEVGISTTLFFEALTGEIVSSDLELHNEGSTAIFYSWQKLTVPQSFQHLSVHFYFNFSSGVICPGDTERVEFIFKTEDPGLKSELWQLNTHPVLMQGASMQVRLSGVAFSRDKTADQRLFIESKLEKTVVVEMCRSTVYELLQRVYTPERPRSPAELYITEEQQFLNKNPKLQYLYQPVEALKRLWHKVNPGGSWDFSIDALQQAVLSYEEPTLASLTKEESLAELNSLFLQLSGSPDVKHQLTAAFIGQQLWKKLLDKMSGEAMRLRNVFGLPEKEMWVDGSHETVISDAEDKLEKKGAAAAKEEKNGMKSKLKGDIKRDAKSPTVDSSAEEIKRRGKRKDDAGRRSREWNRKGSASLTEISLETIVPQPPDDQSVDPELTRIYTKTLHKKVYALMEELVDNLCDLMEEISVHGGQRTSC